MASGIKLKNPFVGLRAFEEDEDYLFFGRTAEINDLLKKFGNSRLLAVVGSSGSGKSSLVKSGLLPAIYSGFLSTGRNWRVALFRPGDNPIGNMARELAKDGVLSQGAQNLSVPIEPIIESTLRRSTTGLVQAYRQAHFSTPENLLIVIDQFEELFRYSKYERQKKSGRSDAMHFVNLLLTATRQVTSPVYVLITMRSDFIGDCAEFRGLPEAINEGQYLVPRMTRDEIREAIKGPIAVENATITQRLVTRLLNDVGNDLDQLPILQHAMMRTWDAWQAKQRPDTPIDIDDYERIGGMKTALSLHAEEIFSELTADKQRKICELMFKALTDKAADVRGIRRPRSVDDLSVLTSASPGEVMAVVELFRKPGRTFLMPPPNVPIDSQSIIDISHESLMRIWQRLIQWTEEEVRWANIYRRLGNDAMNEAKGEASLWRDPELSLALRWRQNFGNEQVLKIWAKSYDVNVDQAIQFLNRSEEADKKQKREKARRDMMLKLVGVFLIILFATLTGISYHQMNVAKNATIAALVAKRSDSLARVRADSARLVALNAKHSDSLARIRADSAMLAALDAKHSDSLARVRADSATTIALDAKRSDSLARIVALQQREIAREQNLKIAFNEYARLIREGPSEENKNDKKFYDSSYLLAYRYHFDQLANLIAPDDRKAYASVRDKLYYNNDLYIRVYQNFADLKALDSVRRKTINNTGADPRTGIREIPVINQKGYITIPGRSDKLIVPPNAGSGQKFISATAGDHLFFGATDDNLIYVFNEKLEKIETINMGARVTALDYNEGRNIIYFGTVSGYIGYIIYGVDRKNQPVFENKLETEIRAIQYFNHSHKDRQSGRLSEETFLLAAAKNSNPKVYKLDEKSLYPDKHLSGNELLYSKKDFGDIRSAFYIPAANRVLLNTATGMWLWNPFTEDLLEKLNQIEQFYPGSNSTNTLIRATQFY